ncbi:autophagy-related protein 9B isoform X5 [Hippopotamus amphibius kiboko]|uniref:autophagy-related protein 9B isoform X5 n=1 Tax=Hippopotamus amphibius kiboko TaxID=575201 RepID=UPI002596EF81|nr:autophagy-related protein 9B isoform X5 [Hippopotamus amphibius kiboko]
MVRRMGWGGTRGRLGRWGDLGPGSVPLLPMPLPPLPPTPCRGPGGGRVSIFSLSPAPHTRSTPSSAPPSGPGPLCPAAQAPGASQPCQSALPTPATPETKPWPGVTPLSAPPSWDSHSAPPLASETPPPPRRCPQDPPGLRIGPLIPEQDYERLEDCDPEGSQDSPLHGEEQQPLLHVPEGLRGSWHHIQNLDSFFTKVYSYHQRSGFACILLEDVFQLGQFIFIVTFTTFLLRCVDYNVLFANQPNNRTRPGPLHSKVTLSDAILPSAQCAQRISSSPLLVFLLILASAFGLFQLLRSVCNLFSYWDIQMFYREALHIPPAELSSVPWAEVQSRLLALQRSGGLCVQPRPLTELDVHHRILRYTNYQVALANKGLLPARCALPWGGGAAFLSGGLALNVDLLLYRGPFSLFRGGWELPDAYKRSDRRAALAARWRRTVLLLAAVNLALSPLVLAWQVLHAFYSHAALLRREPGALGTRRWSRLARLQLRHFNELPHELRARLARAYRPAAAFLRAAAPPAPLLALLARQLVFFAGALFAALLALTVYDEDVLAVEHVLTAMTALGILATVARAFIPDERGQGRSPQLLLQAALAHMHYLPEETGPAGRTRAHRQMARLLQYRVWLSEGQTEASLSQRAEDGKTELSLMRFSLVHPQWRPPGHSSKFLGHLRGRVQQDAAAWGAISVHSPPTPGILSNSSSPLPEAFLANLLVQPLLPPQDLSPTAPCPAAATASLLASISRMTQDSSCVSPGGTRGQKLAQLPELASAEMSLHAIYLHQLHEQQQQELWGEASASSLSRPWSSPPQTLSPDEEKPSWSSDGSSPASSPRQQWRTQRTQNVFPGGFQEPTDTQKEPGQATSTD